MHFDLSIFAQVIDLACDGEILANGVETISKNNNMRKRLLL
jgi:hypothetical protein